MWWYDDGIWVEVVGLVFVYGCVDIVCFCFVVCC